MDISWLEAVLYGLVSGLTEYAPVSSQAHQMLMRVLFGYASSNALQDLFVHLGMLIGLLITCGGYFNWLYKEYSYSKSSRRRRKRDVNYQAVCDIRVVKFALIPVLLSFAAYSKTVLWKDVIPAVALFMVLNGVMLIVPMYLHKGNKDSRNMSVIDSLILGFASSFSVLPGVSLVGAGCSSAAARGADPGHAYKWCLLVSLPVMLVLLGFDFYFLVSADLAGFDFSMLLMCVLSGVWSLFGSVASITLLKMLTKHSNLCGFAYYSFGTALFAFILYLYC